MYVDGKPVTVVFDNKDDVTNVQNRDEISGSMAYATVKTVMSCPYGVASDYTVSAGTKNIADINLSNDIVNLVCSVFIACMIGVIPYVQSLKLVSSNTIQYGAGAIWNYCQSKQYHTKHLSFKGKTYYHKKQTGKGYVPSKNKSYIKFVGTYYTKRLYAGNSQKKTNYEVISY